MKTQATYFKNRRTALTTASALLVGAALNAVSLPASAVQGPGVQCDAQNQCTLSVKIPGVTSAAIAFQAAFKDIAFDPEGYVVKKGLSVKSPRGAIPLPNANVVFTLATNPAQGLVGVNGTSKTPFPTVGITKNIKVTQGGMAQLGINLGKNLEALGAHLNPNTQYLYFRFNQGLSGSLPNATFTAPGGKSVTAVLDPADPYIYLAGSGFSAPGKISVQFCDAQHAENCTKQGEDYGFGLSVGGNIPFTPIDTATDFPKFKGHLVVDGSIPLGSLPLSVTGTAVINADADKDGVTLFDPKFSSPQYRATKPANTVSPDLQVGATGTLDLTVPFLKVFETGITIGQGTAVMEDSDKEQSVQFTGVSEPGTGSLPLLPKVLPVTQNGRVMVSGLYVTDISDLKSPAGRLRAQQRLMDSRLEFSGNFNLDASNLGRLTGVNLGTIGVGNSRMVLSKNGFSLSGQSTVAVPYFAGNADVQANIPPEIKDIDNMALKLKGDLSVAGLTLANGLLDMNRNGAKLSGKLAVLAAQIDMSGTASKTDVNLAGTTTVNIPVTDIAQLFLPAFKQAIELVNMKKKALEGVDGTIKTARDAADKAFGEWQRLVSVAQAAVDKAKLAVDNDPFSQTYALIKEYSQALLTATGANKTWLEIKIGALRESLVLTRPAHQELLKALIKLQSALEQLNNQKPPAFNPTVFDGLRKAAVDELDKAQKAFDNLPKPGNITGRADLALNKSALTGTTTGTFSPADQPPVSVSGQVKVGGNGVQACFNLPGGFEACTSRNN